MSWDEGLDATIASTCIDCKHAETRVYGRTSGARRAFQPCRWAAQRPVHKTVKQAHTSQSKVLLWPGRQIDRAIDRKIEREIEIDRVGGTGRQRREARHGNLLTVFDPCGRVQPETDLFEPWRLDGSRLTLMSWQWREGQGEEAQQDKDGEKREVIRGKEQEGAGDKREYNWIRREPVVEKSAALKLSGKDKAEVW